MRNLLVPAINKFRIVRGPLIERAKGWVGDHTCGAFLVPMPGNLRNFLRVIAASGDGWDHVSVSCENRCPTWEEMEYIKRLFFHEYETAMQLHVPVADHINAHPYCLHLWRPLSGTIPRPPSNMVG